jgi:chitin disaccharide deacetylase
MFTRALLLLFVMLAALAAQQPASSAPTVSPAVQTLQEKLGYPANARLLILHADDLGMSHSVNRATLEALEKGWVSSASILVPCPWFPEVATWAKAHPDADLGIHLALNSEWTPFRWGPVAPGNEVKSLLDDQGYMPLLENMVVGKAKPKEVEKELRAQIEKARKAGVPLSHFDSHMTTLMQSPDFMKIYVKMGKEYDLPLLIDKKLRSGGMAPDEDVVVIDETLGIGPGVPPANWLQAYKDVLHPLGPGVYQLIVHTAYDDEEMRGATFDHPNWGSLWRQLDFDMVKSAEFQQFLRDEGFTIIKWKDFARAVPYKHQETASSN